MIESREEGGRTIFFVRDCPVDFESYALVLRRSLERTGVKTKIEAVGSDWEISCDGDVSFSVVCQNLSPDVFVFHPFYVEFGGQDVCDSYFGIFLEQTLRQVTKYHPEPAVEMAITDDLILDALEIANDPMALEILDIANGYLTDAGRTNREKL